MNKYVILAALLAAAPLQAATVITQWNFNSGDDANAGTGTLTPSVGTGVFSNIGGTTASYVSGSPSPNASSDPEPLDNSARNITTFPAAGSGSGTAGAEFTSITTGYEDITITWDMRPSATGSRYAQLQYSVNSGGTWIPYVASGAGTNGGYYELTPGNTFFNGLTADLSGVTAVDNLADLRVRIVSVFAPATSAYAAASTTSSYGTAGTWRFDMVTVSGTVPVPEPGAAGLLLGAAGLLLRRRRA